MISSGANMMRKLVSALLHGIVLSQDPKQVAEHFGCSRKTAEDWIKGIRLVSDDYYHIAMNTCGLKPITDQEAMSMIDYLLLRIGRHELSKAVGYAKPYAHNIHKHNGLIVNRWRYHKLLEVYTHEINNDPAFIISDKLRNRSSSES
jgi:hypothetical protein